MDIRTKRLRNVFEKSGLTQTEVCEKTGINKGALSSYLSGRYFPKQKTIDKLSKVFNVSINYLMGFEPEHSQRVDEPDLAGITNISFPASRPIPILGDICAGEGTWCEENFEGHFFIDSSVKADFCVRVRGDSMINAGIRDGDLAFIKRTYDYKDGNIYAVRINSDCEAVLKKVFWQDDTIILNPCNAEYKPIVTDSEGVSVVGECIGVYHSTK
ncbi:MAG: helix-turn-helix domain-containing protein [[Eubacterium] sulci]|nr:helix-turn-helix domain-containing protein [[Eubacterium] sulci]